MRLVGHATTPTPPTIEARFQRVKAKLAGFVNDPQRTLRDYPESDRSAAAHYAPDEALVAAVEAKVRHLRELSDLYAVRRDVGFELATVLREGERDAKQRERELLETIIARGETAGAFREFRPRAVAASAIQALVEAMAAADIYDAPQGTDGHRLIDAVLDLLLSGLKRRP